MKKIILSLILCLGFTSNLYAKSYGGPELDNLMTRAYAGDVSAYVEIGTKYFNDQDYDNAYKWFRDAAERGNTVAMDRLGYLYHHKLGRYTDIQEAVNWYYMAANLGNLHAQYNLAFMYYEGFGVAKNIKEAERLWRDAAYKGEKNSQKRLNIKLIDPAEIGRELCNDYNAVKNKYKNKNIILRGRINNSNENILIFMNDEPYKTEIKCILNNSSRLHAGGIITLRGNVIRVENTSITLDNCEILANQ